MKRGTIVVVAARVAYTGEPRPAVVVPSDLFNPTHASIAVSPVSQAMLDKIVSVPREAIGAESGECDPSEIEAIGDGLRRWLDLGA